MEDDFIVAECSLVATRQRITIDRQIAGRARLGIGKDGLSYDDQWDFPSVDAAKRALLAWSEGEPTGWHRHPRTGRYRINGDPRLEYVRSSGDVIEQVRQAVNVALHAVDKDIIELTKYVAPNESLPARSFLVGIETPDGNDLCTVYYYPDHCVVIPLWDDSKHENIIRRLTEH